MRDVNRLFNFYSQLSLLHRDIPDIRFGQLMYSFIRWAEMENKNVFYLEEDEFLKLYTEFINDLEVKYVGVEGKFGGE